MRKSSKLALLLVLLLALVFPTVAFGDEIVDGSIVVENEAEEDEEDEINEGKGNGKNKPWKEAKAAILLEKDGIEAQIDEKELLLEAAETAGDEAQVALIKEELAGLKSQFKEKISAMQQIMKEKYTPKELAELEGVAEDLESSGDVDAIPVENVIIVNGDAKFDTPPVIKEGRTVIPVRAISEGMGAEVEWNEEEKTVTITKDDKVIVFNLTEETVYVGDVETTIDVPAEIMNNRTMIPLRFIAEQLGLKVEYNEEMQTIEVE